VGGGHDAIVPAPRDQVYARAPWAAPALMRRADLDAAGRPAVAPPPPAALAERIARIALARHAAGGAPPAPLYIRGADAAPPRDAPPVIVP